MKLFHIKIRNVDSTAFSDNPALGLCYYRINKQFLRVNFSDDRFESERNIRLGKRHNFKILC